TNGGGAPVDTHGTAGWGEGLETIRTHAPWSPPRSGAEVSRRLRWRSGAPQPTEAAHLLTPTGPPGGRGPRNHPHACAMVTIASLRCRGFEPLALRRTSTNGGGAPVDTHGTAGFRGGPQTPHLGRD